MAYRCFEVDVADGVAHIRMSRPDELNSMVPEFWRELPALVDGLSAGGEVRAAVVSSTGRHFTAGMDLSVFAGGAIGGGEGEPARRNAVVLQQVRLLQRTFTCLEKARFPVIAAVQGGAVGAGVDLVTACDVRYASEDAFFVVQETNIGMAADVGTLQRLGKVVNEGFAREMALTGRRVPAARAFEVGLVQQVFPDHASLVEGALATAREMAAHSPLVLWGVKEALNYARDHSVDESLEQIALWNAAMLQSADMTEALTAKLEKRAPSYSPLLPEPEGL